MKSSLNSYVKILLSIDMSNLSRGWLKIFEFKNLSRLKIDVLHEIYESFLFSVFSLMSILEIAFHSTKTIVKRSFTIITHAIFQYLIFYPKISFKKFWKHCQIIKLVPFFEVFAKKTFELMCYTWLYNNVDYTTLDTIALIDADDKCFFVQVS